MENKKEAQEQIRPPEGDRGKKAGIESLEDLFKKDESLRPVAKEIRESLEEVLVDAKEFNIHPLTDFFWKEMEERGIEVSEGEKEALFEDFVMKKFVPDLVLGRIMQFVIREDFDGGAREIRRMPNVLEDAFGEKGVENLSRIKMFVEKCLPPEILSLLNPESEEAKSRALKKQAELRDAARQLRESKENQEEGEESEEGVAAGGIEEGEDEKPGGAAQETFAEKIVRLTDEQIREEFAKGKQTKEERVADNFNIHHPELRPGEVFLINVLRDPPPGYSGFETLPYKTKRMGEKGYDPLGLEFKELAPVFVKREEYKNEYGKRP